MRLWMERIRRQPATYPIVHETYRRALIRRFPHAVFYEYAEPAVRVYAVFHAFREPEKWRHRLP